MQHRKLALSLAVFGLVALLITSSSDSKTEFHGGKTYPERDIGPEFDSVNRDLIGRVERSRLGDGDFMATAGPFNFRDGERESLAFFRIGVEEQVWDSRGYAWKILFQRDIDSKELSPADINRPIGEIALFDQATGVVTFTFEDAIFSYTVPLRRYRPCMDCSGSGKVVHSCRTCLGDGLAGRGWAQMRCPSCKGQGLWNRRCRVCLGKGRLAVEGPSI